jgi:hypothetical protein
MASEQLAAQLVSKNGELAQKTKTLAPIRKECKTLKESILQSMEQSGEVSITLPSGVRLEVERKMRALPIKQDYIAEKLAEIAEFPQSRAAEIAQRIWDERPAKESAKLKLGSGTPQATERKRGRRSES